MPKHDAGKLRFSLLPWDCVTLVVRVLEFGASKYGANNYQKLDNDTSRIRYRDAAFRHLVLWQQGEWLDEESGLPHAAHAACSVLIALWHDLRFREQDHDPEAGS